LRAVRFLLQPDAGSCGKRGKAEGGNGTDREGWAKGKRGAHVRKSNAWGDRMRGKNSQRKRRNCRKSVSFSRGAKLLTGYH